MPKFFRLPLLIVFLLFLLGCGEDNNGKQFELEPPVQVKIIFFNSLNTHELIVRGSKLNNKVFPETIFVQTIGKNDEVEYRPIDLASIEESGVDLTYAWSPDGRYLVLPRGRFEGFTVFSINDLPQAVANGEGFKSIAIQGVEGTMWWHQFEGWKNAFTVKLCAGLSSECFKFEWNIKNGKIYSLDLKSTEYKVNNN